MRRQTKLSSLLCAAAFVPASSQAAFTLLDDFESATPGGLDGQGGWSANGTYTVVTDPAGGSNQVLQTVNTGANTGAHLSLGANAIANGATGTLFARFRFNTAGNGNFGLTDVDTPTGYGDYRAQINRQGSTPIKGRDAGVFQDLSGPGPIVADNADAWYNIWVVANNDTDTSEVYIQSDDDALFAVQTLVTPPDGTLNFRTGTANALDTLKLRAQDGTVYFDDFYASSGTDLSNPVIPEPTASALLLLGMSAFMRRKRR